MTLGSVKAGDIVECDVRGERFYAFVSEHLSRELEVTTLRCERVKIVSARQVVGHWRKRKVRAA